MKTKETQKVHTEVKQPTYICVCNMEWRGIGGDPEEDCICTPEETKKPSSH